MKQDRQPQRALPLWLALLLCVLCAGMITLAVIAIQPGGFFASLRPIFQTPSLIVLNALPALVLTVFFFGVTGNVFFGAAVADAVLLLLGYANLLKLEGRNDPLVPADVTLLRESLNAAQDYGLNLHPGWIAVIVLSVVCFAVPAVLLRRRRTRGWTRLVSVVGAAGVFLAAMLTVYPSSSYYQALPGVDKSNVPLVFNTYGFPYCFLHNFNLYPIEKPKGYSSEEVRAWEQSPLPKAQSLDVDVLFVMGEAFTDLSDEPQFGYTDEDNPIRAYHAVADSTQAVSGHIVVSGFGAGTSNTEFDVLTGMQTAMLSEHTASAFRTVHRDLDTIARLFRDDGYATWFLHPGYSWFYNRSSVYRYFGISEQIFRDAFSAEAYDGNFVTDAAFLKKLCERWDGTEEGQFAFSVTIENHQAYSASKYASVPDVELNPALQLTGAAEENLRVYFYGAKHTAEMIADLAAYLDTRERPTLLVFFGDHRPALGANRLAYEASGSRVGLSETMEDTLYTYQTPFMIWGNRALCEQYDFAAAVDALELPEDHRISASYLGSLVYELTGRTGESAYWDALTQARRRLSVITPNLCERPDGTLTDTLSAEEQELVRRLQSWTYARMKYGLNTPGHVDP